MNEEKLGSEIKGELEEEERRRREKKIEKEEKSKDIISEEEKRKNEVTIHEKEKVFVPLIGLERVSNSLLKKLELNEEIHKIEKNRRVVLAPVVGLKEPTIILKEEHELDYKIPNVEKDKKSFTVPIFRIKSIPKLSTPLELDAEIRKPLPLQQPEVKILIYRKDDLPLLKPHIESLDSAVNEQFEKYLERRTIESELKIEKVEASVSEPEAPSSRAEEEVPDIFTLIFSISGGKIDSGNPKVIVLKEPEDDSYIGTLETLCMRIYREKVGGKPKPKIISKIDDIFKPEVEKWMEAEGRIFSVEFNKAENLDNDEKDFLSRVQDRIEELFSQQFGFIIFKNPPVIFTPKRHVADVINIEPKKMDFELKKEVASMIWGFISLDDVRLKNFDYIFETARMKFAEKLRSIGEPYLSVTKRDKGLHESDDLHYPIKLFLVKYLAHEMNLRTVDQIKEFIKTEEEYGDFPEGKRPDVHVTSTAPKFADQVFEVETLFSEGDYPLKKIDETIEKYEKTSVSKVNIILDNITFLRHINGLRKKLNIHKSLKKEGKRKFDLEFYTLDLQNEKLIPLSDIVEKLRSLNQKFKAKSYS